LLLDVTETAIAVTESRSQAFISKLLSHQYIMALKGTVALLRLHRSTQQAGPYIK